MYVSVIVPAAGSGRRMGRPEGKLALDLGGKPVLLHTLEALQRSPRVDEIVLVVRPEEEAGWRSRLAQLPGQRKVRRVVAGGERRQDSVARGLAVLDPRSSVVVVHDGARPLVSRELLHRTIEAAAEHGAAVAAMPVTDTVKEVSGEWVQRTLDRSRLWAAQTPQAFRTEVLREAYAAAEEGEATDDAALVERLGQRVRVVRGEGENLKLTTRRDLELARMLVGKEVVGMTRVGMGYDAHRLVSGRPLILGGVRVEHPWGLEGHSDADVLVHAAMDALLGAAGEEDIGSHFPPEDPRFRGADSVELLGRVGALLSGKGWRLANLDLTLLAERPRLAPYVPAIKARLGAALGVSGGVIGVKATTTEGMGWVGRGEGMAALAVALLVGGLPGM
ncbi:MAG: 2-C-methyl-D-erythritol 4-phosphate cytidylyltransferase [Thermaerobacter sp.]|nr:2-C-methyl-D-erythritol 4-phosphate cytidylyltransferase [Thermaerobacter sp.]